MTYPTYILEPNNDLFMLHVVCTCFLIIIYSIPHYVPVWINLIFLQESTQGHSTLRSFRELRRESTSSTLDRQVSMFRHNATSRTNSAIANSAMTLPFDLERPQVEDTAVMKYLKVQVHYMYLWLC